jgi:hypothetical protein
MTYYDQYIAAGTQQTQIAFLDSQNIVIGNSRTAPAAGATPSGSYNAVGIQDAADIIPEGEDVSVDGDDGSLGAFNFASADPRNFILNMGQFDLLLNARLQNTGVVQVAGASMGVGDSPEIQLTTVAMIIQGRAIKRATGQSGQAAYTGFILPVVTIRPLDRAGFQGRTAAQNRYQCTVQLATHYPYGVTFASNVEGVLTDYIIPFSSEYPMTMDAFTLNGVVTSWTLSKTPVSVNEMAVFAERVAMTVSSVTPSTKNLTLASAGITGQRAVAFYGYSGL